MIFPVPIDCCTNTFPPALYVFIFFAACGDMSIKNYFQVVPKVARGQLQADLIAEAQQLVAAKAAIPKAKRKAGDWVAWPPLKKQAMAEDLTQMSWTAFKVCLVCVPPLAPRPAQLKYSRETLPPESTLRGWRSKAKYKQVLLAPGRPKLLQTGEEDALVETIRFMRSHGAVVDREVLAELGRRCLCRARGMPLDEHPPLPLSWVRSFQHRHHLCRLRRGTTDRHPSTPQELQQDEAWRRTVMGILATTALYGINCSGEIPPCMVAGMDETPLLYCPAVRGTYIQTSLTPTLLTDFSVVSPTHTRPPHFFGTEVCS